MKTRDDIFADAQQRIVMIKADWQRRLGRDPDKITKASDLDAIEAHCNYHRAIVAAWVQARNELEMLSK